MKFNFAHLGGENWWKLVMNMCCNFQNVYSDISFTFKDNEKVLDSFMAFCPNKVLFGTDSYLIQKKSFYKAQYMKKMQYNTRKFLEL